MQYYDTEHIVRTTGLEPARIRFLEAEFKEFLCNGNGMPSDGFDRRQIELLKRLHQWMFVEGRSVTDIQRALRRGFGGPRIIAVTSGKGGVGKTTLSVNLAVAMAARGSRTLLFDADMGLGNVHLFAGIDPRGTLADMLRHDVTLDEVLTDGPGGIKVLCSGSGVAGMADLESRRLDQLAGRLAELNDRFDTIVVDTGAGISSHVTRFLEMADDIVVVVTPDIASTLDAYGVIKVCRETRVPGRIRMMVNLVKRREQAGVVTDRIIACAERFLDYRPEVLGYLSRDAAMDRSNQKRRPLLMSRPGSTNAKRINAFAETLSRRERAEEPGAVERRCPAEVVMAGCLAAG